MNIPTNDTKKINVLVIDDSAVIRGIETRILEGEPDIKVIASANNGKVAIDVLKNLIDKKTPPHVITLDIEMPEMDGITAIPHLVSLSPKSKIIMVSTLTQRNAEISLKAMSLGATDYIPKPTSSEGLSSDTFKRDLVDKVRALGNAIINLQPAINAATATAKVSSAYTLRKVPITFTKVGALAIGSSTGGPQALLKFFNQVKGKLPNIPIFLTQHMPPIFTQYLAKQIAESTGLKCIEAQDNQKVESGCIYVAPGDFHMNIVRNGNDLLIKLTKEPPEHFCRPSVNPMLRSLVDLYGNQLAVIIFTGMGADGSEGSKAATDKGGIVIAQDEATSVVWGMPGAVTKNGLCSYVEPIDNIGNRFLDICNGKF